MAIPKWRVRPAAARLPVQSTKRWSASPPTSGIPRQGAWFATAAYIAISSWGEDRDLRLGPACAVCLGSGAMADSLLEALPDLIVLVRREGTVMACAGGGGVGRLQCAAAAGQHVEAIWPAPVAQLLKQLIRRALATRTPVEARFDDAGLGFEARVSAQGPDRAICVIR